MGLLICLLIFISSVVLMSFKLISLHRVKNLPPGPNALKVLYYLPQMVSKPHRTFRKLAETHGPLISMYIGNQIMVIASSPEAAKQVCRTHDRVFSGRHSPYIYQNLPGTVDSSMVLSPHCDRSWKLLRSMGQRCIFGPPAIEMNARIRREKVVDVVEYLKVKEGEVVNLDDLVFANLANFISSVLTSSDLVSLKGDDVASECREKMGLVHDAIEKFISFGFVDFLPVFKGIDFWSRHKAMDVYRKMKLTWGDIIKQRRLITRSSKANDDSMILDFLDLAIAENSFSDDQIYNALMEIVSAATDSTGVTSVWLMAELIRNQKLLHKVREEIESITKGDVLNESLLSQCSYLQACIKETLRLHVPAPLLVGHRATETCNVSNYTIPKDSVVFVNSWAICRDPNYWEDAEVFKPERFLDTNIGLKGTQFEYLPFGSGLRMCPGSNLAFKIIQMLAGSLLYCFDWDLPNGEDLDMKEKYMITLKKEKALCLIPKLRVPMPNILE